MRGATAGLSSLSAACKASVEVVFIIPEIGPSECHALLSDKD